MLNTATTTQVSQDIADLTAKIAANVALFAGEDADFTLNDEKDQFTILTDDGYMTVKLVSITDEGIDFDLDFENYYTKQEVSDEILVNDKKEMLDILTGYYKNRH